MKAPRPLARRLLLASLLSLSADVFAAAAFTPNNQPTGWVGEVEVSNFDFSSGTQTIYKGDYVKGAWTGNLYAYPVDAQGAMTTDDERYGDGVASWIDDTVKSDHSVRRIVTMHKNGTGVPFKFDSTKDNNHNVLDATQLSALGGKAQNVINFVRGSQADEKPSGEKYRARTSWLGDIIHSRPLYVDDTSAPRVYVGANDGMLHAFDAKTGEEVFAYIPSFFISPASANFNSIKSLTTDPYTHMYFVDASPNAAKVGTRTILVGGVGPGGKGLYALDISNPGDESDTTAAARVKWEITPTTVNNVANTAYANLGHTYGYPLIAKTSDNKWSAIVANGYNNKGNNHASLYVIDLDNPGTPKEIIASAGVTSVSDSNPNGLSSPTAIDVDRDGKVDYVYAGDINGNLWRFDLRNMSDLKVMKLYATSPAQPITGRPIVSLHPKGGYMINFATGRMFTSNDVTDSTTVYYAYGVWDNAATATIGTSSIVAQTLTQKTWTGAHGFNFNVRVSSSNAVDYSATTPKLGWSLALPAGERVVGDGGLVTNQRFVFSSYNPTVTHAAVNGVTPPQGDNWLNEVDFTTGGGGNSLIFDLDANLKLDDDDRVRASGGTSAQSGPTGIPVSRYIIGGVMSPPVVARLKTLSEVYFNTNPDMVVATSTPGTDPGVSGGHFDFDIYYGTCSVSSNNYSCGKNTHVHEYDDKYNVTGVNMLAPSLAAFNLVNPVPGVGTKFKILMANQKLSPAVKLLRGGLAPLAVTGFQTTAGMTMASQTIFWRNANASENPKADPITSLTLALPLDAFQSKDWTNTGDVRAGVMPTATGCVHSNLGSGTGATGPWMNGALTVQIVKDTTPDSAVEYSVAGDPSYGYRLKKDATSQGYQLAQYTLFWHHPNGKCYGQAGWVKNPPQDASGKAGASSTKAIGADDPEEGEFGTVGGVSGVGTNGATGPQSSFTYYFADGTSATVTITTNPDGTTTSTTVTSDGRTFTEHFLPESGRKTADTRAKTGRVSWREMVKP